MDGTTKKRGSLPTGGGTGAPQNIALRDWFAGQALMGMLANPECSANTPEAASYAFRFADAMLAARARGE